MLNDQANSIEEDLSSLTKEEALFAMQKAMALIQIFRDLNPRMKLSSIESFIIAAQILMFKSETYISEVASLQKRSIKVTSNALHYFAGHAEKFGCKLEKPWLTLGVTNRSSSKKIVKITKEGNNVMDRIDMIFEGELSELNSYFKNS